jgi:hypothetical protein
MEEEDILHANETVPRVLHEPCGASRTNSYMWFYMTGVFYAISVVLYEYQETRSSSHPRRFLEGFDCYPHCDGYYSISNS